MKEEREQAAYLPSKGDRVRLTYDDDDTWGPGVVVAAGPQASLWRADSDKRERGNCNRHLKHLKHERIKRRV